VTLSSKEFRVTEGYKVDLSKWPTAVPPVYRSTEDYEDLLAQHVEQLSALQQLHDASNAMPSC
jgi:hypothetical protein